MSREKRRFLLKMLADKIRAGEFDIHDIDIDKLYRLHSSVREEYLSPYERSGYNYGYMTSGDLGAGNEESF